MRRAALSIIPLVFWASAAFAQTSIKAEVNKTSITTDEALTYKLTIESSEKNIPQPQLPNFENFAVVSQGHSSNFSISAGKMTARLIYTFLLSPAKPGKLKIGPAQIKMADKSYTSEAFEIEVKQGKIRPKGKPEKRPSIPEELLRDSDKPQITI